MLKHTEHLPSDTVAQKIQEYRERWAWEQQHYKQLKQQELYGDVDDPTNIVTQCAEKEKENGKAHKYYTTLKKGVTTPSCETCMLKYAVRTCRDLHALLGNSTLTNN